MPDFVCDSALPSAAGSVLLGEKYAKILENSFHAAGIVPIFVPSNPDIDPRLSGHVDLSVFSYGRGALLLAPYLRGSRFAEALEQLSCEIIFSADKQGQKYPHDANLNACRFGNRIVINERSISNEIVNYLTIKSAYRILKCRQGYANCSLCVVSENAVITSDGGIAQVLLRDHVDVLLIESGYIELPGFSHGFIGGSAFLIEKNTMAFTGRLDLHPDRKRIEAFLNEYQVSSVYLTERPIFDIGGIIPLTEKPV